jgi:hypothetical protein
LFKANVNIGLLPYKTISSLYGSPLPDTQVTSLSIGLMPNDAALILFGSPVTESQMTFWGMGEPLYDAAPSVYFNGSVPEAQISLVRGIHAETDDTSSVRKSDS